MILQRLPRVWRRPAVDVGPYDLYVNPYPWYRILRDESPVAYAPALRHYAPEKAAYWLVTRWDDVVAVLKDDETFRSPDEPDDLPASFRGALPHLDGERHDAVRATMHPPCRPQRAKAFADDVVSAIADELLDGLDGLDRAELMTAYFEPFAARTMAALIGLPGDLSTEQLREWFDHLGCYFTGELLPRNQRLDAEIDEALLDSLRRPGPDADDTLLASMRMHRPDAGGPTDVEIVANAKFFAAAGTHELADLTAHALVGLLSRRDQLDEVRADPALAKPALEEAARWASPVGMVPRLTTVRTELAGVRLPAGTLVSAVIASANRDERHWSTPSRFDLHRDEGMHIGYASGIHFCIGAWIARAAAAVGLRKLVERLPDLQLTPGDPLVVTGWRFRDVRRFPARWA